MKKIKNFFCRIIKYTRKTSKKKKILIISLSLGSFLFIYFFISFLSVSRSQVYLLHLQNSINQEKVCHETCRLNRNFWRDKVINSLAEGDSGLERQIKNYFLNELESPEFKKELLIVLGRVNYLPDYIFNYLQDSGNDSQIRADIITYLLNNSQNVDFYFSLIINDSDQIVREAAVKAISNLPNKNKIFDSQQLKLLEQIIFDPNIEDHFRSSLILLLGDYYDLFPQETQLILNKIYQSTNEIDKISRLFAADILISKTGQNNWSLPSVDDRDWQIYFNHQ